MKAELAKLKSDAARGTLRKETGNIRTLRRNMARVLTVANEKSATQSKIRSGGE